ncbi:MAG: Fe-S cluster assembly protein SufD [Acidobacteria bacterium]|nr:Fe-S cluster assembly protein SufD [Acidobacteriota bacterium]MCA1610264.1 Fe-S cluster assembly protein SufD [Acidobacteriota bacterium]
MPSPVLSADTDLAAAFADLRRRTGGYPAWLGGLRERAFARFQELGFPTSADESWKHTNVAPIARIPWEPVPSDPDAARPLPVSVRRGDAAGVQLGFSNGRWSRALSSAPADFAGIDVLPIADVLRDHPEWLEPHFGRHAAWEKNPFTAWNTALAEDGAFIRVSRGAASGPIHLLFLSEGTGAPTVAHPRNLILLESGAQATVVETYVGEGTTLTNAVTEISVGDGAFLDHAKIQRESPDAFHVQSIAVTSQRSSQFTSSSASFGGSIARTDIGVLFAGEGGDCTLNGLFVGEGSALLDTHTTVDHATPHCTSRQVYKGILDGRSRGVFHGTVLVRKDAQKTDAIQSNKNLLLSRDALVHSTPALEIFADDVKCKHGSTIGQLDAAALFYLRSRGIGEQEARALLTWAFASDVVARFKPQIVREEVERALSTRLPGRPR